MSIVALTCTATGAFAVGLTFGAVVLVPRVGPWRGGRPAEPRPVIVVQEQDLRTIPAPGAVPPIARRTAAGELLSGLGDVDHLLQDPEIRRAIARELLRAGERPGLPGGEPR